MLLFFTFSQLFSLFYSLKANVILASKKFSRYNDFDTNLHKKVYNAKKPWWQPWFFLVNVVNVEVNGNILERFY